MTEADERSYVETHRREKRAAIDALGIPAFAYRFARTHRAAAALAAYTDGMGDEGPRVAVAGRVAAQRSQGKTSFIHLEDESGRIQGYLRRDALADQWNLVQLLDLDDHIGLTGRLFRTRTGEVTVRVDTVELLAKALRPLPRGKTRTGDDGSVENYGGLTDPEVRYRQRYVDLAVHPEVREVFRTRADVTRWLRQFLDRRGYLEVETPILQPLYGGAAARPFVTRHHALDMPLYLRIADELYLKRLLVGGFERVYEIGHDFRNEGMDRTHNPEFTMLEFYEAYADYTDMLALVETMIRGVVSDLTGAPVVERGGVSLDFGAPFQQIRFRESIQDAADVDVVAASDAAMREALGWAGVDPAESAEWGRGKLQDALFSELVEPSLVQPTFVLDHPKSLSPLAKTHRETADLVERFELIVAGTELANAFTELNDPDDQRRRFEDQGAQRQHDDDETQPYDADYIRALEYGMPPAGGVGVGVDRLVMLITGQSSIRDVLLFPAMRPEA